MVRAGSKSQTACKKACGTKSCRSKTSEKGDANGEMPGVRCQACHAEVLAMRSREKDERLKAAEERFRRLEIAAIKSEEMLLDLRKLYVGHGAKWNEVTAMATELQRARREYKSGLCSTERE